MPYRVVATEILDDTDRVVFDALDNKRIRRELCKWMNKAESAETRAAQLETERKELIEWRDAGAVEIEKLTAERDEALKQLEQAPQQIAQLESEKRALEFQRDVLRNERDELARQIAELKEERDNLRMSIVNNVSA